MQKVWFGGWRAGLAAGQCCVRFTGCIWFRTSYFLHTKSSRLVSKNQHNLSIKTDFQIKKNQWEGTKLYSLLPFYLNSFMCLFVFLNLTYTILFIFHACTVWSGSLLSKKSLVISVYSEFWNTDLLRMQKQFICNFFTKLTQFINFLYIFVLFYFSMFPKWLQLTFFKSLVVVFSSVLVSYNNLGSHSVLFIIISNHSTTLNT